MFGLGHAGFRAIVVDRSSLCRAKHVAQPRHKGAFHFETFSSVTRFAAIVTADQVPGSKMSDSYIIEVKSRPAGIVVRDKDGFRFFSASPDFSRMEGRFFRSAREAEREAMVHASSRSREIAAT